MIARASEPAADERADAGQESCSDTGPIGVDSVLTATSAAATNPSAAPSVVGQYCAGPIHQQHTGDLRRERRDQQTAEESTNEECLMPEETADDGSGEPAQTPKHAHRREESQTHR